MMIEVNIVWWFEPMTTMYFDRTNYETIAENVADWFSKQYIRGYRFVDHEYKPAKIVGIGYHN